jgi:aspartyl/glutamyl-tRNA(Asn/Gln) amidotransferase C subunit
MPVSDQDWRRIVANARLRLTAEEEATFRRDLDAVLDAFSVLDRAPTSDVSAFHPIELPPALRDDVPEPWPDPDRLLKGRPMHGRMLKGPRI